MFSLNPGSLCDVCAEEYGSHNYPHSIPCGESPSQLPPSNPSHWSSWPSSSRPHTMLELLQQHTGKDITSPDSFLSFLSRALH